jgi:hypothetical protein
MYHPGDLVRVIKHPPAHLAHLVKYKINDLAKVLEIQKGGAEHMRGDPWSRGTASTIVTCVWIKVDSLVECISVENLELVFQG